MQCNECFQFPRGHFAAATPPTSPGTFSRKWKIRFTILCREVGRGRFSMMIFLHQNTDCWILWGVTDERPELVHFGNWIYLNLFYLIACHRSPQGVWEIQILWTHWTHCKWTRGRTCSKIAMSVKLISELRSGENTFGMGIESATNGCSEIPTDKMRTEIMTNSCLIGPDLLGTCLIMELLRGQRICFKLDIYKFV